MCNLGPECWLQFAAPLRHYTNQNYWTQNGKMRKFTHFIWNNLSIGKCLCLKTQAYIRIIRADKTNIYRYLWLHTFLGTCLHVCVWRSAMAEWSVTYSKLMAPTVHPRTACNQSNTHTYGTYSTSGIYICEHRWHKKMPKHKKFISIYYDLMELCMWKTRIMTAGNCRKEIYCWSIKCTLHWRERVAIQQIHTHRQLIILHL